MSGSLLALGGVLRPRNLVGATILMASLATVAPAHAIIETDTFCGPASGMTCETQPDLMIFLQKQMNVTVGFGNIGPGRNPPVVQFSSDSGALNMFIDLANGFATITPAKPATTFNGIDFSIPGDAADPLGYGFTQFVFDEQLTPAGGAQTAEPFTITAHNGNTLITPIGAESDQPDTDKEFSVTAVNGIFTDVNIQALTGFDEMKHFEVSGVCAIQANGTCEPVVFQATEPASLALLSMGLLGLGFTKLRRR